MTPEQERLINAAGFKFQDLIPTEQLLELEAAAREYALVTGHLEPDIQRAWAEATTRAGTVPKGMTTGQAREEMLRAMTVYSLCRYADSIHVDPDCIVQKDDTPEEITELDVEVFDPLAELDSAIHSVLTPVFHLDPDLLAESVPPPPRFPPPLPGRGLRPLVESMEKNIRDYIEKMDAEEHAKPEPPEEEPPRRSPSVKISLQLDPNAPDIQARVAKVRRQIDRALTGLLDVQKAARVEDDHE